MMIASDRQIKLSTMTGKLTGFKAINTNTVTNEFCQKMNKTDSICGSCYSMAMLQGSRKNCQPAWQNNSELLSQSLLDARQLPVINERYFRFHGHGELINQTHFDNLCRIAEHNPATTFALWTKRRNLIGGDKPSNLILIYSNPTIDRVMAKPPKGFDKVFNNVASPRANENCTGQKCADCLECYRFEGSSVIIERVKIRH